MTVEAHALGREIRVGLISVGWMGRVHTNAYLALATKYPELGVRTRLVHAADNVADRATYAQDVLGYERSSTDYRAVLEDPEVEVVSICAPNMIHREVGVAAAEAGKPFWIEKPVGRGLDDTTAVAAAVARAGVVTSIGYNYRNAPAVEHMKELVANGDLGHITNVRSVFYCGYASDPRGALSWRFLKGAAGSGALGDLLSHVVDLVQYVVAPIREVSGLSSIVHRERPILPMGQGDHFAIIEGGEMGSVENDDHTAVLIRFDDSVLNVAGAIGTIEASRTMVGPVNGLVLEIYGTKGSAMWNFERMNELRLCTTSSGTHHGYTTIIANGGFGDYSHFQPGPGNSMSYDDLKTIEAKKFIAAVLGLEHRNSTIEEALLDAHVLAATEQSSMSGLWVRVPDVPGATFGRGTRSS